MVGHLQREGMIMTPEPDLADVLIVNTCSFIDVAKEESVQTIIEAVNSRQEDPAREKQKIIVAGCLSQRFNVSRNADERLPGLLPEVDAFIGLDQVTEVGPIVRKVLDRPLGDESLDTVTAKPRFIPDYTTPRFRLTPGHMAYVKIAEGCNHTCSFCIIPTIRGQHRSRTQESVVREAESLVQAGVKELNLISQDTTYFGMDRWEGGRGQRARPTSGVDSSRGESLATLLRELNGIEGDFWIRLLYTHPAHWSNELIETIATCEKVAKYVDIPLQHVSDHMLDVMNRKTDGAYIRDLLERMRRGIPGLAIRTTFITGFPGETREDHDELLEFIRTFQFERCGIFSYSREEGTRAHKFNSQLHHMTIKARHRELTGAIDEVAESVNQNQVGAVRKVLVEEEGIARSEWDASDIDGRVFVPGDLPVGEFAKVRITDHRGYDLIATGS